MFVELRKPAAFGKDVHGRLCFRNRSEETSKDVFDCSVVFLARMGGGFATVKAVVEHKGTADESPRFRAQLTAHQPIALAETGVSESAIWRMADKRNRAAQRVGKHHTRSQPVQQSSVETQKFVEPRERETYSGSNRDVRLQTERFEELVVQVHLARTPDP